MSAAPTRPFSAWYQERISINPQIQGGAPCIVRTRFPFETLVNYTKWTGSFEEFVFSFYDMSIYDYEIKYKDYITEEDFEMAKWYVANLSCLK